MPIKNLSGVRELTAVFLATLALLAAPSVPAATAQPLNTTALGSEEVRNVSGPLNPDTFAGLVLVATTEGEVLTYVEAGGLQAEAAQIREGVAEGVLVPGLDVGPGGAARSDGTAAAQSAQSGGCGNWQQAVAGITGYAASTNGCAVFGYTGYYRPYSWSKWADASMCVQGKGWSNPTTMTWWGLGCSNNSDVLVPWGNVLAYTQVRGYSLSGVTGAAYNWYD